MVAGGLCGGLEHTVWFYLSVHFSIRDTLISILITCQVRSGILWLRKGWMNVLIISSFKIVCFQHSKESNLYPVFKFVEIAKTLQCHFLLLMLPVVHPFGWKVIANLSIYLLILWQYINFTSVNKFLLAACCQKTVMISNVI